MKPSDFYFQLVHQASGSFFLITPVLYYDTEGCLSDESGVADSVLPKGFYELTESTYEYEGTLETGRQLLIDIGTREIDFGFNNAVEPSESNEEDYYHEDEESDEEFQQHKSDDELDSLLSETEPTKTFDLQNMLLIYYKYL